MSDLAPLPLPLPLPLPPGLRARFVPGINGLDIHLLEAGFETPGRPLVLLLHGFPELAFSWRHVMPALAAAGYHVVAPDQRGYGRTTGWDARFDGDIASYRPLNLLRDMLGLVDALGYAHCAVVGHDFGATVAAWAGVVRPDVFRAVVLMSAPFSGPPPLRRAEAADIHAGLAALPRPRRHYQWYYSTAAAGPDMHHPPQGLHAFLRAYYHHKSADWPGNVPFELPGWNAAALALLPTYYVMDLHEGMAATVVHEMPDTATIAACRWLPDADLAVYAGEYARTGFQGALHWYRCRTEPVLGEELELFAGCSIDVPSCFIAGAQDWGIHQVPGAMARMNGTACTRMEAVHLIDGAGHWVQQEQPAAVSRILEAFLARHAP